MNFSSVIFIFAFLPVMLTIYYVAGKRAKNIVVILGSLAFYGFDQPKGVILLLISIFCNYAFALGIENFRQTKRAALFITLAFVYNLGILWLFKYFDFTVSNINILFGTKLKSLNLFLPVGISFFSFKALSYCCDVYYEMCRAKKNMLDVALYLSFFPQISSGPIQTYHSFEEAVQERHFSINCFSDGILLFIRGLAKKVILSNQIAELVDIIFVASPQSLSVLMAWLGSFGWMLQLYFDFSGYSDMAIGLGKMFGVECEDNFDYPYLSKDVSEFWRKWHISFGTWFKLYVYNPIFRSLLEKRNVITKRSFSKEEGDFIALVVVWLFTGIWHGANWTYIFWGLYNGFFIICERKYEHYKKKRRKKIGIKEKKIGKAHSALKHVYLLVVIAIGSTLFRSPSLHFAFDYIRAMFGIGTNPDNTWLVIYLRDYAVVFLSGIVCCFPVFQVFEFFKMRGAVLSKIAIITEFMFYAFLLMAGIAYAITATYNPFIYFNF